MLNGDKNIKKEKQYEPKETTYEWEYGTVKNIKQKHLEINTLQKNHHINLEQQKVS